MAECNHRPAKQLDRTTRVHGLEHTAKTLAMPSSSTLHYATKQLDDTLIINRTQPFTNS